MRSFFSNLWSVGIVGTFLTGMLFLLPVVVTIYIITWLIGWAGGVVGPGSFLGGFLSEWGARLFGIDNDAVALGIGILIAVMGIWMLGFIVTIFARRRLDRALDGLLSRIPFVSSVYNPVARVVRLMGGQGADELSGMLVVACRFGGETGADVLALLTSNETFVINGEKRKLVYIPTSPVPMSGGLLMVPEHSLQVMQDMSMDDLMKIYLSLGALAPDAMPKRFVWPDPNAPLPA